MYRNPHPGGILQGFISRSQLEYVGSMHRKRQRLKHIDFFYSINSYLPPSAGTAQLTATSSVCLHSWIPHVQPVQSVKVLVPLGHEKPSSQISPVP